jgi:hypothetical protein
MFPNNHKYKSTVLLPETKHKQGMNHKGVKRQQNLSQDAYESRS